MKDFEIPFWLYVLIFLAGVGGGVGYVIWDNHVHPCIRTAWVWDDPGVTNAMHTVCAEWKP